MMETEFRKASLLKRLSMPVNELCDYYMKKRAHEFSEGIPIRHIRARKILHFIPINAEWLSLRLQGIKFEKIHDKRKKTGRPVIFACTHVGFDDVPVDFQIIREKAYLLYGSPGSDYRGVNGLLLWANGWLPFETTVKEDRRIAGARSVELLKRGCNLHMYPEGTWNIQPEQVVMPLFAGAVDMAIQTGADIVPVAIDHQGKRWVANVGENISYIGKDRSERFALTDMLRDTLCTLKWEIWERFGVFERAGLAPDEAERFHASFISQLSESIPEDSFEYDRFHPPGQVSPAEAFAHLKTLIPKPENAFLFAKN